MACTRSEIIILAQSWVGLNEADGSHKKIVDIYNSHTPLARGYQLKYSDPWCAGTVSALAIACNATDIIPTEVSCGKLIDLFKEMGIWVEADDYTPLPGDFVVYDWDDNGIGDNVSAPEHIGIAELVAGNTIHTIEGNYDNSVKRRYIEINGKHIRGFACPQYLLTKKEYVSVDLPVLKKGDKGGCVKSIQSLLELNGFSCGAKGTDGSFGGETEKALMKFQEAVSLEKNGICSAIEWKYLIDR